MDDLQELIRANTVLEQAKTRYEQTDAYHSSLLSRYRQWHRLYAPVDGDQWPEDAAQRPGKAHVTSNIIKPFVDVEARLQAKLPRVSLRPASQEDEGERARAELAEKVIFQWLEDSEWELLLQRLCRVKSIYGKAILRPFWNKEEKRPDVQLIEAPENLRIGWGASDFSVMDWALYEYSLSPTEVKTRWPDAVIRDANPNDPKAPISVSMGGDGDHSDPLDQKNHGQGQVESRQPSDYERKQILVWDYWYREGEDIYNCIILQRNVHAKPPTHHKEYAIIPYIVVENDHEPGNPEGMSTVEQIKDIQYEMNRALSQFVQLIVDNIDPAWQVDDDAIPDGGVPRGGEIVAAGEGKQIRPLDKGINTFPIDTLMSSLWNQAHRTTGSGEILFGSPASAQDSGRALAVQVESVINRMEPKRLELYSALKALIAAWIVMVKRLDPALGNFRPKEVLDGQTRWKFVGPEITPKDAADHTNNVINKVNAMLLDLRSGMDELGVDSPEEMLKIIAQDRSTLPLNPGNVQAMAQVGLLLLQLQQMGMSLEQIGQASQGLSMPGQEGANLQQQQQQQALPRMGEDQNQPATGRGGVAPIQSTNLVRTNAAGESQSLGQLAFNAPVGPAE